MKYHRALDLDSADTMTRREMELSRVYLETVGGEPASAASRLSPWHETSACRRWWRVDKRPHQHFLWSSTFVRHVH